jgi:hypothetical protein
MEQDYQIEMDDLAIGLTKPATKLGVPFIPFFMSIMGCFFGWMLYQSITGGSGMKSTLLCLMIWLISYAAMLLVTSRDIFGLAIYWINLQYFRPLSTRWKWGNTDAYQP